MAPREKQAARVISPQASPQKPEKDKRGKKGNKSKAPEPLQSPPVRAAAGRRAAGSQVNNAAQDAIDEARVMAEAEDVTPPASPPPLPRGAGGLTERQKKAVEEQQARNDKKVIAYLNAKLAASNAQLKLAMENAKKRKESSSGEAVNPQPAQRRKLSNAST